MNLLAEMARAEYEKYFENLTGDLEPTWDQLPEEHKFRMRESVRAALSAARDRGWVLVPVEPDEAMVKGALSRCKLALGANVAREMLKTAISAAPSIEGDG